MRTIARRAFDFYWGTGIADDVPALTYYLVLSLAPVALGLAALEALLLSNTQAAINVADGLNRFLPDAAHADILHLVLGTRDNSPVAAGHRAGHDAVDHVGRHRRHRALRVAHPRLRAPPHRHRSPAQHGAGGGHRDHGPRGEHRRAGHRRRRRRARTCGARCRGRCWSSSTPSARSSSSRCSTTGRRARDRTGARACWAPCRPGSPSRPCPRSWACTSARAPASPPCGSSCCWR